MNMVFITFLVLLLKLKHDRIVFLKANLSGFFIGKKGKAHEKERESELNLGF